MSNFCPESRIVLAPLAGGPATPELAAAVTGAGGLGFVAAGYLTPEELATRLRRTRALTGGAIGVNLFCLRDEPVHDEAVAAYAAELAPEAERLGARLGEPRFDDDHYAAKLDVALEWGAEVVSFTFGLPPAADLDRVRASGAAAWVTVVDVAEALEAAAAGVDAIVAQGSEAGGHRGGFRDVGGDRPLLDLVREIVAATDVPVVATGGCADRAAVVAALDAGAQSVQVGTAFLLCSEAGTSEPHRRALAERRETALTRAFTGRRARGLVNDFMRAHPHAPAAYPHVHHLTAPLRAAARAASDPERINLWAGESYALARAEPAADVVARLRV